MDIAGDYVFRLTAVSLLVAIASSLLPEGTGKALLRLVGGIFLAAAVLQPLKSLSLSDSLLLPTGCRQEAEQIAAMGKKLALDAQHDLINKTLTAYILDKAAAIGAEVTVRLTLDEEGFPGSAEILGTVSESQRDKLSHFMEMELGIPKENQQWTG